VDAVKHDADHHLSDRCDSQWPNMARSRLSCLPRIHRFADSLGLISFFWRFFRYILGNQPIHGIWVKVKGSGIEF